VKTYLVVVGLVLLLLAVVLFVRRVSALLRGASAVGRVQGHEARTSDDIVAYFPIIEFADSKGDLRRFTSVAGGSSKNPGVGTTVRVRYLRSNPRVAYIQSFLHMWAAPSACAALGLGALAVLWQL
jgi:hypothetical protein